MEGQGRRGLAGRSSIAVRVPREKRACGNQDNSSRLQSQGDWCMVGTWCRAPQRTVTRLTLAAVTLFPSQA